MQHILIIDDEQAIRRLLRVILEGAGHRVSEAADGENGLRELATSRPDLLILDLAMPGTDGFATLRRLREWSRVSVLVLSAKPDPADKVLALDLGADDYLTKPFDSAELLARLRALLRRTEGNETEAVVDCGGFEVDLAEHRVLREGKPVPLTPTEFALLAQLARHRGRVLTHAHLLTKVWGPNAAEQGNYLRVHFAHLRRKLTDAGIGGDRIVNEPGIGYRLVVS